MSNLRDALPPPQRKPLRISTDLPLFTQSSSDSSSSSSSPPNQNVTPETTPSTGVPQYFFHVLCMHDFQSSDPIHLPFRKDEILTIVKQEHSGWWAAMRPHGDRIGWIPSSFVLPLHRSKYPDGALGLGPFETLNDPPLSAVHDPWVPVSEDSTALSFRLVTPTDYLPYKGFSDDGARNHDLEPFPSLPNDERSPDAENSRVLSTCRSPPPHSVQRMHPQKHFLLEPGRLQPIQSTSPPLPGVASHRQLCPRKMYDEASLRCLVTPVSPDIKDWLVTLDSFAIRSAPSPNQTISNFRLLELAPRNPDGLVEQLCVLMHTLYAAIHQNDFLNWMAGRKNTNLTGLQHFFDAHDRIASWVQQSILVSGDITRQAETLDSWIRVAEKCHALRNFDSLCAIILVLSRSSFESAWSRCVHKEAFATLHNMLDVTNKFSCLMDIMDAAEGPSVPFVRRYLEHIKELHVEHSANLLQSRHAADASSSAALCETQLTAVSTLLRHQSSPYDFKVTKFRQGFIYDELRTASQWREVL